VTATLQDAWSVAKAAALPSYSVIGVQWHIRALEPAREHV